MKIIKKHGNLELIIEDSLITKIADIGISHFPNEFGGFLIGEYSDDLKKLYVKDYILPKIYKGQPFLFERSIEGIEILFKKIFNTKKQYYLGEWHTHPNGSTHFSNTDLNAMIKTVECETVKIYNPILLILSISESKMNNYTFYFYDNKKLIKYE